MKYLEDAINMKSPWAKKYLELVSRDDQCENTVTHHIVPVAFYEYVLHRTDTRQAGSPDMEGENLVKLSGGHHLLAHYYLYRCARPCIKPQMASAVSMMFNLKDIDLRLSELTEQQAKEVARAKDEAKEFTGLKIRNVPGGFIGKYYYENGKLVYSFLMKPNGKVRKYVDNVNGFCTDEDCGHVVMTFYTDTPERKKYAGSEVIASTRTVAWDRKKMDYVSHEKAFVYRNVHPDLFNLALTFREIVKKFYGRYNRNFGEEWNAQVAEIMKAQPGISPLPIHDIPVNVS